MPVLIVITISVALLLTLLGNPAPDSIAEPEIALCVCDGLLLLSILIGAARYGTLDHKAKNLLTLGFIYFGVWFVVALLGLQIGNEFFTVFRSFAPQVAFVPIFLAGICLRSYRNIRQLHVAIVLIGAAHCVYLLYLFLVTGAVSLDEIVLNRTTFLDSRTTLPLFLGAGILPLPLLLHDSVKNRCIGAAVVALAFAGAFSTQTRAQVLALVVGCAAFFILATTFESGDRKKRRRTVATLVVLCGLVVLISYNLEIVQVLAQVLIVRSYDVGDTGRISDEWIPALSQWVSDGPLSILFGIGLGSPIFTASGEERTYAHNLIVYLLVYTGVLGCGATLLFYAATVVYLIQRAHQSKDLGYIAYAALVISLFAYAQLFAVHKLLSYNALVACGGALAMGKPIATYVRNTRSRSPAPVKRPLQAA